MPEYHIHPTPVMPVKEIAPGTQVYVHFPQDAVVAVLTRRTQLRMWVTVKQKRAKNTITVAALLTPDIVWEYHNRITTVVDVSEAAGYTGAEIPGLVPVSSADGFLAYVRQDDVFPVVDGAPVLPADLTERDPVEMPLIAVHNVESATSTGQVEVAEEGEEPVGAEDDEPGDDHEDDPEAEIEGEGEDDEDEAPVELEVVDEGAVNTLIGDVTEAVRGMDPDEVARLEDNPAVMAIDAAMRELGDGALAAAEALGGARQDTGDTREPAERITPDEDAPADEED